MPVTLPGGVIVYNVTPHEIRFKCEKEVIVAKSDGIVNALIENQVVYKDGRYTLVSFKPKEMKEGRQLIDAIHEECPEALIVGSIIAAQAYPEEVVSSKPFRSARFDKSNRNLVQSRLFTVFPKGEI